MTDAFTDPLARQLADGFARHVERWALARGAHRDAARAAARAAREASLASASGHACVPIERVAGADCDPAVLERLRLDLESSAVTGTPGRTGSLPLVLDADGRVYLHRYFDYERRLAQRLARARAPLDLPGDATARLRARLAALFPPDPRAAADEPDWRKLAVALALGNRATIVSGGPGTGKTTMVVNLLACLLELDPACRIALAAPTGKAAARMIDAIRERAAHLPVGIRDRLPDESFTIHRLLGVTPAAGGFVHHAGNPLPVDALVVDEASMLDLALATRLLEAVPDGARIVLLGDKDQLAAVEAGAVFAELSRAPALGRACRQRLAELAGIPVERIVPPAGAGAGPAPLEDCVVWFTRNFRFAPDSGIGRLAALVKAGNAEPLLAWLGEGGDDSVRWAPEDAAGDPVDAAIEGYARYVGEVAADPRDRAKIAAALARYRVLCAVREGPRGVEALNAEITRRVRSRLPALDVDASGEWYLGRPVLVRRNDYVLKLFNGDVGIALPDDDGGLAVVFPDAGGGFRSVSPARLPAHETAFAMTVHQSQGSEFDEVLVVLPDSASRVLTRELLYTAVTRARTRVSLSAGVDAIAAAVASTTRRHSGLIARLQEVRCAG